MGGGPTKNEETMASPTNSQQTISDDDEIDYETRPEFYGSDLDEKDESWVSSKRKGRPTDAVLSCPACFTTLCLDCQRYVGLLDGLEKNGSLYVVDDTWHDVYLTQYRAMFVVNCKVTDKTVLQQGSQKRQKKRKGGGSVQAEDRSESESVRQVCCSVCSTAVGVIDEDEVYHFYDVLPSES